MKIKVLHVIGSLRIGGAENVAMNIYRYIDRDKYEFHYLVYGESIGDYEEEVMELGGKVIHMEYSPQITIGKYMRAFSNIVGENGPYEIVHAHMMLHNGLVLKVAKILKIPVRISHAHSTDDGKVRKGLWDCGIRQVYNLISRKRIKWYATHFLSCGDKAGNFLYGYKLYKKRGVLIKNGIDIEKFCFNEKIRYEMRKKYGFEDKIILGCVGHFEPVKNHNYLISLFEKIYKCNSNTLLLLLGDGKLKDDIYQKVQELHLEKNVLFTGNVANVSDWMQAMDCLLMPSLYEGVPVTLIEAQASGLKCFVSDTVSTEVNVTGDVTFFPLKDSYAGWRNIANLNIKYERRQSGEIVKQKGYDVKSNIKKIEEIYNQSRVEIECG